MTFKPRNNANPNGRPKKPADFLSAKKEKLAKKHDKDLDTVVANAFKAGKKGEPWAIKYVMEFFIPKPSPFAPTKKRERNQINVQINNLLNELPPEKQHLLWEALAESEKVIPALASVESIQEAETVEVENTTISEAP